METILIATDFSPAATNAINYGVELAKYFNAKIVLVHAYPIPTINENISISAEDIFNLHEIPENRLINIKEGIQKKHGFDLKIECIADMGMPYDVIESVSSAVDAGIIIMGLVGEAGILKERLIGSNSFTVARRQKLPTLIIPESVSYKRIKKISFTSDLSEIENTNLIEQVKYFVNMFNSNLEIVNVRDLKEEVTTEKIKAYLNIENKLEGIRHKTHNLISHNIVTKLEDYFLAYPTDLIIVNPGSHNYFYYIFNNSITSNLAFHVHTPILALH